MLKEKWVQAVEEHHLVQRHTEETTEEQATEIGSADAFGQGGTHEPEEGTGPQHTQYDEATGTDHRWHEALGHHVVDAVDEVDREEGEVSADAAVHVGVTIGGVRVPLAPAR